MPPNAGAGVRHARQKLFRTYWQMSGKKSPGSGAGVGANTELDPWTFATLYKTTWISRWGFFLADDDASKYLCSVISKGLPRRPSGGRRRWDGRRNFLFKIPGKPLALPAEFLTENPRQNAGKKSLGLGAGAGANPDYFRNAEFTFKLSDRAPAPALRRGLGNMFLGMGNVERKNKAAWGTNLSWNINIRYASRWPIIVRLWPKIGSKTVRKML